LGAGRRREDDVQRADEAKIRWMNDVMGCTELRDGMMSFIGAIGEGTRVGVRAGTQ